MNATMRRLRLRLNEVEKVPEGYRTTLQWQKLWKLARSQTNQIISAAVRKKWMTRRVFRVVSGGRVYPVPHYAEVRR